MTWTATYGTAVSYLTTELNALADAGWALSAVITNNVTALDELVDIPLVLASAVTAGTGSPSVDIYLLPIADGTTDDNPPGASAGAIPAGKFVGAIPAIASASFTSGTLRGVVLPPGKYRIGAQNNLGVAMPATGNTLKGYPFNP